MKIIPLKDKHKLTEQDISDLSKWLVDGKSLAEMSYALSNRLSAEQIYVALGHVAREMYDCSVSDLNPDLAAERMQMNDRKRGQWQEQRNENMIVEKFKRLIEDLSLYEMELMTRS